MTPPSSIPTTASSDARRPRHRCAVARHRPQPQPQRRHQRPSNRIVVWESSRIGYWADDSGACGPFSRKPVYLPRTHPIYPTVPSANPWRRGNSYTPACLSARQTGLLDGRAVPASNCLRPSQNPISLEATFGPRGASVRDGGFTAQGSQTRSPHTRGSRWGDRNRGIRDSRGGTSTSRLHVNLDFRDAPTDVTVYQE